MMMLRTMLKAAAVAALLWAAPCDAQNSQGGTRIIALPGNPSSGASSPNTYLGAVATRGQVAYSNGGGGITWIMSRTMHWSRDTIVNPTLLFCNCYITTANTEVTVGAGTEKASIEYPSGTFTLCGGGTTALPNGLTTLACPGVTIPNNTQFWVRNLQVNTNGANYAVASVDSVTGSFAPDAAKVGTGTPTDLVTSGSFAAGDFQILAYFPMAILAQTQKPSILIFGDSRNAGVYDFINNATADTGDIARSLGPSFGYSKVAVSSTLMSGYLSGSHTYRDQMTVYFSHLIQDGCINDITGGATAATCAGNRATFAALYPNNVVIGTTLERVTTSSDNWVTTANQGAPNVQETIFNQLVRLGIAGESNYFDIAYAVDPARQNLWPPAPNPYATSLTPIFSGTGSISTAGVLTVTACSPCTLTVGMSIIGTSVPIGDYVVNYGTNVSIAGLCTPTCAYQLAGLPPSAVNSTTITASGFFTNDGTHLTPQGEGFLQASGAVTPSLIHR